MGLPRALSAGKRTSRQAKSEFDLQKNVLYLVALGIAAKFIAKPLSPVRSAIRTPHLQALPNEGSNHYVHEHHPASSRHPCYT
jgi:hypothetical protein